MNRKQVQLLGSASKEDPKKYSMSINMNKLEAGSEILKLRGKTLNIFELHL